MDYHALSSWTRGQESPGNLSLSGLGKQVTYLVHVYPQEQYIYLYNCLNSALLNGPS